MHPTCNHDCSSYCYFFWSWTKVGDNCHFTVVSSNGFTDYCFSNSVLALRLTQLLQKFCAVRVGIWIAMCHIYFIVVMHELSLEGKCIVETTTFLFEWILEVTYTLSISIPSNSLTFTTFCFFFRIKQWLHTLVIRTLRFHEINYVELVCLEFLNILNPEVKPLSIVCSVMVVF